METQQKFDRLVREFFDALPDDLRRCRADFEHNAKAALRAALARMDLVTREEFDLQSALLARTRAVLEELEGKLAELEARLEQSQRGK